MLTKQTAEMIDVPLNIPIDKFSSELRTYLYHLSNQDLKFRSLLEIAKCKLDDSSFINLKSQVDISILSLSCDNSEIIARINDLKFILNDKDKKNGLKTSVQNYFKVYDETKELKYLIRAYQLIRKIKSIFKNELDDFELKAIDNFIGLNNSYFQKIFLESFLYLIKDNKPRITQLTNYALINYDLKLQNNDFNDAINYINILKILNYFDSNQYKIQIALCLEKEGDYLVSKKEPNTYYPNILSTYTKALKEIKGISKIDDVNLRLQTKIKKEQSLYFEMLTKIGISTDIKPNLKEFIEKLNINSFQSAFNNLIEFPFIKSKNLETKSDNRQKFLFSQFFKDYIHISNKGTISGKSDENNYYLNQARQYYRTFTISFLKEIKFIMDINHELISKDLVATMIFKCKSPFIPNDREYFFIEGIYQGFQNNFSLASHILIPQIENSLKYIIELNGRNTIKLAEDIQNDNTLGSILNKEKNNKMLDGICDPDIILELNNFLCDGNSVNFRNKICHGLISPFETEYYGIYLWWITLKMIKQTEKYFKIPNK